MTTRRAEPILAMVDGDSSPLMSMLRERRIETWFQPIFTAQSLEKVEEMELMRRAGVDLFQGFLFGKPNAVPATMPLVTLQPMAA